MDKRQPLLKTSFPALLIFGGLVTLFIMTCLSKNGIVSIPLDDGWIHLGFAKSLVQGRSFSIGMDSQPVSGSTAPLWTFLLSLPLSLGLDPVVSALGLGLIFAVLALLATASLGTILTGSTMGGMIAACGLAMAPRFAWGALSGMEVPLFTFLVVWGLVRHLKNPMAWAGIAISTIAGWARPECFAIGGFLALHASIKRLKGTFPSKSLLPPLLAFVSPLLIWVLFHMAIWGKPLPTTFYVKAANSSIAASLSREGIVALWHHFVQYPLSQFMAFVGYIPAFNLFLCSGAVLALLKCRKNTGILVTATLILFFSLARGFIGFSGPYIQHGRYYMFLLPLWLSLSVAGLISRASRKSSWWAWSPHALIAIILPAAWFFLPGTAGEAVKLFLADAPSAKLSFNPVSEEGKTLILWLLLLPSTVYIVYSLLTALLPRPQRLLTGLVLLGGAWSAFTWIPMTDSYAGNVGDTKNVNVAMAEWIRDNTPSRSVIACHDLGAIGFFAERKILDLAGIGTPEVLFWKKRRPDGTPDRLDYLRTRRPDYLCFLEGWFAKDLEGLAEDIIAGRLDYKVVHKISAPGNSTLGGEQYNLVKLSWK